MKQLILILLTIGVFYSCSHLKHFEKNTYTPIFLKSLQQINGDYKLKGKTGASLTNLLEFNTKINFTNHKIDSTYFVRLTALTNQKIEATLYHQNKIVETKTLKGKLENNYFSLKHSFKFKIIYLLINGFSSSKTRFGISSNGNLILDNNHSGCATLVIFPFACGGCLSKECGVYGIEYEKIN